MDPVSGDYVETFDAVLESGFDVNADRVPNSYLAVDIGTDVALLELVERGATRNRDAIHLVS